MKNSDNKVMTMEEAVSRYVTDGCSLAIGAIVAREPIAAAFEIIRQKKKNLTYINDSSVDTAEYLIAAGCISRVEVAYIWVGGVGNAFNYRRAVEQGVPHYLDVEEYSNLGTSMRLMAGAMGLPFMPVKTMLGSDIITNNPKIKVIDDPYGSGKIALVPAANPDVAIIHVQRADKEGNCQIWGMVGNDDNIARASKHVIITCEEIVPSADIRRIPNMTTIPSYCVSAVVEAPFGCHPLAVSGYYWLDMPFRREYIKLAKTRDGMVAWMDEWIYGVKNHDEYKKKVGLDRLATLQQMEFDNYRIPRVE